MASYLTLVGIAKADAEKNDFLKAGLAGEAVDVDEVILCGKEHYGFFGIDWLGPRSGWLQEGLEKHHPRVWNERDCFMITKEQLLGVLEVSRQRAMREKEEDEQEVAPNGYWKELLKDYDDLEKILNGFDFKTNALFGYEF